MRNLFLLLCLSLCALTSCSKDDGTEIVSEQSIFSPSAPPPPAGLNLEVINPSGVTSNLGATNIIIVGDGFLESDRSEFNALTIRARDAIANMYPFSSRLSDVKFWRETRLNSSQSGYSIKPDVTLQERQLCDSTAGAILALNKNTDFGAFTYRAGMSYYMGVSRAGRTLIENRYSYLKQGDYAYVIVISNNPNYGAGAEFPGFTQFFETDYDTSVCIVSKEDYYFEFLVRHEFGHSFGNLDDEYFGTGSLCPIATHETPFYNLPNKLNIKDADPGGWFLGGRYETSGKYRETNNSLMRQNYGATQFTTRNGNIVNDRLDDATL